VDGYHVRAGLADDPSFEAKDGRLNLHWLYLENEVGLDSDAGWIAIIDNSTSYGMIERIQYFPEADYPGKVWVIFYKNDPALTDQGIDRGALGEAEITKPVKKS
jgi:hypothetical protein